jgi:hypothetical protein
MTTVYILSGGDGDLGSTSGPQSSISSLPNDYVDSRFTGANRIAVASQDSLPNDYLKDQS